MLTTLWEQMTKLKTALKELAEKLRERLTKFLTNLNKSVEISTFRIRRSQECSKGIVRSQMILNQHYRNTKVNCLPLRSPKKRRRTLRNSCTMLKR